MINKFVYEYYNLRENGSDSLSVNAVAADINEDISAFNQFVNELPIKLYNFGFKLILSLIVLLIGGKLIGLVRKLLKRALVKGGAEKGVMQFLDSFVKVGLYILLVFWIANYLGVETTSILAVLGSASVALALALQGSLSNLTGGVLILILKPFRVGDYIIEDTHSNEGTVIEIGLFYTKLRTLDDKIVVLPNGNLANTSLTNLHLSPERRICLKVGISYSSDIQKAKSIIRKTIKNNAYCLTDKPIDVYVDSLDDSAVTIGYMYYVKNEYYFDSKWDIVEAIKVELDKGGIEIPFNQIDVHLDK